MGKKPHIAAVPDEADEDGTGRGGASKGLAPGKRRTTFVITEYWDEQVKREASREGTTRSQIYLRAIDEYFQARRGGMATLEEADDSYYDPQHFYTSSQDKKGHSAQFRINIPKPLAGEIASLIQSGRVPAYRSTEDVARDGLYHRVKQVAQWIDNDDLEAAVDIAMLNAQEVAIMEREQQAEELLDNMRSNISRMLARGEEEQLLAYLVAREAYIDSLPSPYREDLIELVEDSRKRIVRRGIKKKRR